MPQINQLSEIFISQLFWLLLVFGIIYFVIGRGMVPKIRGTVSEREARIAQDLERAQAARLDADRTEEEWRTRMNEARAEAASVTQSAKAKSAQETEDKVRQSAERIAKKVDEAEAKIREAVSASRDEIETVAAEAAQELVRKLTSTSVSSAEAKQAVKAVIHG